ncbi:hypothetical protein BLA29_007871 [Euroglyphus maynei]|uniref:Uncharacterized protein n=1 Tax=Euroglyphus maynei TaxID=6958 RepID=A0A1Y3BSD0_EURMA|nr:hypothetical protein BLA29_007871 [Euroglyphus maynei]
MATVQTNGSQKFVPNGRYGRRSDLPPLSSMNNNNNPSSYDINQFFSDADMLTMNQDAENMLMMDNNNNNNINWSTSSSTSNLLSKQLWLLCTMNEDKIIMNRCLRSIPIIKMILMKAAVKDRRIMPEIDAQPQILQQTLKHQRQQQQQQGQDQDRQ